MANFVWINGHFGVNDIKRSFENFCLKTIDIFCQFAWKNRNYSSVCLEKSKFFVNLPGKNQIFPWKNRNFSEICLEKSKFFDPYPRTTPRFQTRLTLLIKDAVYYIEIVRASSLEYPHTFLI